MRLQYLCLSLLFACVVLFEVAGAQSPLGTKPSQASPSPSTLSQKPGAKTISLDDAIQMALHTITICWLPGPQSITEQGGRDNGKFASKPGAAGDSQFLPIFQPSQFSADYSTIPRSLTSASATYLNAERSDNIACRQPRIMTAVTRSQVADNERSLAFSVASQFINVELAESTLELATEDLEEFSGHGGHWRGALQSRRHWSRRSAEAEAANAPVPNGRVCGTAIEGARTFGSPAIAWI